MIKRCYHCPENHEFAVKTPVSIVYLQQKIDETQNSYLTQALVFLAKIVLKEKKKLLFEKIQIIYFTRVCNYLRKLYYS